MQQLAQQQAQPTSEMQERHGTSECSHGPAPIEGTRVPAEAAAGSESFGTSARYEVGTWPFLPLLFTSVQPSPRCFFSFTISPSRTLSSSRACDWSVSSMGPAVIAAQRTPASNVAMTRMKCLGFCASTIRVSTANMRDRQLPP